VRKRWNSGWKKEKKENDKITGKEKVQRATGSLSFWKRHSGVVPSTWRAMKTVFDYQR